MSGPERTLSYEDAATTPAAEVLTVYGTSKDGLAEAEVSARRAVYGTNDVRTTDGSPWELVRRQFLNPFAILLAIAVVLSLAIGEMMDAALVVVFLLVNAVLGFVQEYRAEQAAALLRKYWKNEARVVRDGKVVVVDAAQLVPGDVIRIDAGDRVPADVRLTSSDGIMADESVLTGESVTVPKGADAMSERPKGAYDAANILFSGTSVTAGDGEGVVLATGDGSALGKIVLLSPSSGGSGAFEREIFAFSTFALRLVFATVVLLFIFDVAMGRLTDVAQFVLFVMALIIGVIPEALPVVMTVARSRAALLMAKRQVIVKRLSAIDDLGSVDVLCIDKTGTVTENKLRLVGVTAKDPAACERYALAACAHLGLRSKQAAGAFDLALWDAASAKKRGEAEATARIADLSFDPVRKRSSVIAEIGNERLLIVRGAPDAVLDACSSIKDPVEVGRTVEREGHRGRRLLAVAVRKTDKDRIDPSDEQRLEYVGLVSFEDPIKHGAARAIKRAAALNVVIKMLTGDAREVAGAVAVKLGLAEQEDDVMTGEELDRLSADEQAATVRSRNVFARVDPEQKFRILRLLNAGGLSTAFVGEGFNDGPALKAASVGIAVDNASDIAKDAADVILTKKSIASIIDGIEIGRRNFANVIKYLKITLASNFGNFYSVAIASLFVPFLPMLPVQILLLNLLTDAPMIGIVSDSVTGADLKKPRHYDPRTLILFTVVLGIVSSAFDFLTFGLFVRAGADPLRTLWFIESALTEIVLIMSIRTARPFFRGHALPPSMRWLMIIVIAVVLAVPFVPLGRTFFGFVTPGVGQTLLVIGIVIAYLFATDAVKYMFSRRTKVV